MWKKILNYIFLSKDKRYQSRLSTSTTSEAFFEELLLSPHHQWILSNKYLSRSFWTLVEKIDQNILQKLTANKKKLLFIQASGRLSCALSSIENSHIIIIFPDLYKILTSAAPDRGIAILLHEIAHLALDHSYKIIDPMQAQFEADKFAAMCGYAKHLQDVLEEFPDNPDCQDRIRSIQGYL
ncbi:MAG: hypothetical protein A2451_15705 [Bdellovibrionales bacterium RIFOXYC2_FULL_39_8]|nr:MAG: hypothetical protein A2451_15705 [Bdellovibrionales bacterium RIFOXYC2_FULL_39_8]